MSRKRGGMNALAAGSVSGNPMAALAGQGGPVTGNPMAALAAGPDTGNPMAALAGQGGPDNGSSGKGKKTKCVASEEATNQKIEEKNISTDVVSNIMDMVPWPSNYIVNPLMGVGIKSINNYKLFKNLFFSVTLVKNKFRLQYDKLMKQPNHTEIEKEFKFACRVIKRFFYPDIGKQFEVLRVSKEIHRACLEMRHLEIQLKLFTSVKEDKEHPHIKEDDDFFKVFNVGKFEELYNKLKKTYPNDKIDYKQDDAIHSEIEHAFTINGKNCSYIIPYIMHDILYRIDRFNFLLSKKKDKDKEKGPDPKYGYIDENLTQELCAINHTYIEESCDSVYSLLDMFTAIGITKLVEQTVELKPGQLKKTVHDMVEMGKKTEGTGEAGLKGITGGSRRYNRSRRSVPKKRRPTRRRVKLIK
jgi:hypothetical protein